MPFDYFYGKQGEQHAFYRIPKLLFTDSRFQTLSTAAKLLYGMLIDRMELSLKNGWIDEQGRIYLYFTIGEIQGRFRCASGKAVRLLAELDSAKGIGLIESVRQGMGNQTLSTSRTLPPTPTREGKERKGKERIDMISMTIISLNNISIIRLRKSKFLNCENRNS